MVEKEFNPEFGKQMRELRESAGVGLRELARKTGISPSYLSLIEQGKLPPPSLIKLHAIARAINVTPMELIRYTGRPTHALKELLSEHPEAISIMASQMYDLPERMIARPIVSMTAQMVFANEYGKRLRKPSDEELKGLTELVRKQYVSFRKREEEDS